MIQFKLFALRFGLSIVVGLLFLPPAYNQVLDQWTLTQYGCPCYFNQTSLDCACCSSGGCQCPRSNMHQCVRCDDADKCETQVDNCSPHCWNSVIKIRNPSEEIGLLQSNVASEVYCKALCANNGTCIGVYWSTSNNLCWFQMPATYTGESIPTGANYWSLSNCTDDCLSYCWKPVINNFQTLGGTPVNVTDENTCKLLCSANTCCIGIDWNYTTQGCFLIYTTNLGTDPTSNVRHWDIVRNLPTVCQTATGSTTSSSTAPSVTTNAVPWATTAVIVLAVLLGVSVLLNIGLIIEKFIKRKREPAEPENEKEGNYEDLQDNEVVYNTSIINYTGLQVENDSQNHSR